MNRATALKTKPSKPKKTARYLEEGQKLLDLLTDGVKTPYHVRGTFSMHEKRSYLPMHGSLVNDHWLPARFFQDGEESLRTLSAYAVAAHIRGDYWVGAAPPSWTSWFALDIDLPKSADGKRPDVSDYENRLSAETRRDEMLSRVWEAFSCEEEKQPLVFSTPGGGYHLYFPLQRSADAKERTWPAAWIRERVEHLLNGQGLGLKEGELELWPCGKVLRFPCGRRMSLLRPENPNDADDLQLRDEFASWRTQKNPRTKVPMQVLRRDVPGMVDAFLTRFEDGRKPLESWLEKPEAAWSAPWGPWGKKTESEFEKKQEASMNKDLCPSQQYVEGNMGVGLDEGDSDSVGALGTDDWLLFGKAFRRRIAVLLENGLDEIGGRHDAALKLVYYFGVHLGYSQEQALSALEEWLRGFPHQSRYREKFGERKFIEQTLREASHYFRKVVWSAKRSGSGKGVNLGVRPLSDFEEEVFSGRFSSAAVEKAALSVLRFFQDQSVASGLIPQPVELSGAFLSTLCGEKRVLVEAADGEVKRSRVSKVALEELEELGVLTVYRDYHVGRKGRRYVCWYQFGSGLIPEVDETGFRVLARRKIEEGELRLYGKRKGKHYRAEVALVGNEVVPDWVQGMYQRRDFTPAEFLEGEARALVPGPFRHEASWKQKSEPGDASKRYRGIVLSFGDAKGYGFVRSEGLGRDVFFHQTQLMVDGFRTVQVGDEVEFTLSLGEKGPAALWVRPVAANDEESPAAPRPALPEEFSELSLPLDLADVVAEAWAGFVTQRKLE